MNAPATPEGQLFDGKYQIVKTIGEGGMGAVHSALNVRTGKRVAIKTMSPLIARDTSAVQRFIREARSATSIEHPNVVQVFDVGCDPNGIPFMVMELLEGEPLTALIEREAPLAPARLAQLLSPALGALAAAHALGIVHRDLKPDNIFLARTPGTGIPMPKLLDFGISKVLNPDSTELSLTHTGTVLGTPYYMAPEQAAGKRTVDHRSDIYSVGVIIYYALSGRLPFDAENYNALIVAILTEPAKPLIEIVPHIPPAVAQVVDRAMARDMAHRFQSVEELVGALGHAALEGRAMSSSTTTSDEHFLARASITAGHNAVLQQSGIVTATGAGAPPTQPSLHDTTPSIAAAPSRGAKLLVAGLVVAAVIVGAIVVAAVTLGSGEPTPEASAGPPSVAGAPPAAAPTAVTVTPAVAAPAPIAPEVAAEPAPVAEAAAPEAAAAPAPGAEAEAAEGDTAAPPAGAGTSRRRSGRGTRRSRSGGLDMSEF